MQLKHKQFSWQMHQWPSIQWLQQWIHSGQWVSKWTWTHVERKQPNKRWHKDTEKMIKLVENWYEVVLNATRHKWDVSESWRTYFRGGIKLLEHSPCLWKDGNVFRITGARMEIHVVRLDFSPLDCRGAEPTRRSCRNPSVKPSLFLQDSPEISRDCGSEAPAAALTRGIFMKFWLAMT